MPSPYRISLIGNPLPPSSFPRDDIAAVSTTFAAVADERGLLDDWCAQRESVVSHLMDLKPSNILLDDDCVPKISDVGMSKLFCGDVKTNTHNNLCDVEFTLAASAKEGTEIKIDSHVIDEERLLSELRHYVQLLKMLMLCAPVESDDTFSRLVSMARQINFNRLKRLYSSSCHLLQMMCAYLECDDTFSRLESMVPKSINKVMSWISARYKSESPMVGTVSEFSTRKGTGRRNELTENESHPSDSDSLRAQHGIKEGKPKTSTAWVVTTAAPHHATGNRDLLSGFVTEHDDQFVHAVDGVPMKVLARGAVVTDAVVLPDVWFVPGLAANLVSVNQLAELDYSVGFGCGKCCIRSAADGKIMGKAHLREGGLYALDFLKVPLAI